MTSRSPQRSSSRDRCAPFSKNQWELQQEAYGTTYTPAAVPVLTAPEGQTIEQHRDGVTAVTNELRKIPGVRVIDYGTTGDPTFLTDDGRSTFAFVYGPQPRGFEDAIGPAVAQTVKAAAAQHGLEGSVTGYVQLSEGSEESAGPSVLTETLLGAVGALVVRTTPVSPP